jgi:hypothetical protein
MIELNNPLPLLSAKILGFGIELVYEHHDDSRDKLCLTIEAIAWKYCKVW